MNKKKIMMNLFSNNLIMIKVMNKNSFFFLTIVVVSY